MAENFRQIPQLHYEYYQQLFVLFLKIFLDGFGPQRNKRRWRNSHYRH